MLSLKKVALYLVQFIVQFNKLTASDGLHSGGLLNGVTRIEVSDFLIDFLLTVVLVCAFFNFCLPVKRLQTLVIQIYGLIRAIEVLSHSEK